MKASQKNYLFQRLGEINSKKLVELKSHYRVNNSLTELQMLQMILSGEVQVSKEKLKSAILLRESGHGYYGSGTLHFFDFTDKVDQLNPDVEAHGLAQAVISREFQKVKDQIMLGSEEGAIELLRSLEDLDIKAIVSKYPPKKDSSPVKKKTSSKKSKK